MANTKTYVIHGKFHWCKLLGAPRENNYGEKEWSVDFTPDTEGRDLLKEIGLLKRLKDPRDGDSRKESFLQFRQKELKADGTPAEPIRVVNAKAEAWTREMGLIGNESEGNAKFVVRDYGPGKQKGVYLRAIQVTKLVPYVTQDFAPVETDEEFFASDEIEGQLPEGMEPEVDPLDDDIPE